MKLSLNIGLVWAEVENFYAVGYRGHLAGKIWLATDRRSEATPWEWHLCLPMTLPEHSRGAAGSKAEALQALANSLHTVIRRTPPDRLERALHFAAATGLDFRSGEAFDLSVEEVAAPPATSAQPAEPVRAEALTATVQAAAQRQGARPAVSAAFPQRPGLEQAVAGKRMPTVTVKMVRKPKVGAGAGISRSSPPAVQLTQPNRPPATDA